jgi:hypothetical protein
VSRRATRAFRCWCPGCGVGAGIGGQGGDDAGGGVRDGDPPGVVPVEALDVEGSEPMPVRGRPRRVSPFKPLKLREKVQDE